MCIAGLRRGCLFPSEPLHPHGPPLQAPQQHGLRPFLDPPDAGPEASRKLPDQRKAGAAAARAFCMASNRGGGQD